MSDNKRSGNSFGAKGYYIALILCTSAIGITGYLYARSANEPTPVSLPETQTEEVFLAPQEQQDVPALATQPRDPVTAPTQTSPTQTVPQTTVREPMKTVSPVSGEPVFGYSMEALSYNQTTRDWRVHSGIDLAAEAGSPVCAAADGEVCAVAEDDSYGHTVIIRHSEGFTTCYASLSEDIPVRPGDRVTIGQTIGYTSDSAIVETTMGSHVHFSVTCYDEPMDPMDFLAMGK